MSKQPHTPFKTLALVTAISAALPALAASMPDQAPLAIEIQGAKPNVFLMLPNKNSMTIKDSKDVNGNPATRGFAVGSALREVFKNPQYRDKFRLGYGMINYVVKDDTVNNGEGDFNNSPGDAKTSDSIYRGFAARTFPNGYKLAANTSFNDQEWEVFDQWAELFFQYSAVMPNPYNGVNPYGVWPKPGPWKGSNDQSRGNLYASNDSEWISGVDIVGAYLKQNASKAWDLSCRKSYALFFTDGPNSGAPRTSMGASGYAKFVNKPATSAIEGPGNQSLKYDPAATFVGNERRYIPYPDDPFVLNSGANQWTKRTDGKALMSDITAYYYWNDLAPSIANNVAPKPNLVDPSFWQNMISYTIAWKTSTFSLKPEGTTTPPTSTASAYNLTEVGKYRADFINGNTATRPDWSRDSYWGMDELIRAGFAGGGSGYIVENYKQVEDVFTKIMNSILNIEGNDAGVAVGSSTSGSISSTGPDVKYTVDYSTGSNSGDVRAWKIDSATKKFDYTKPPYWSASQRMPATKDRRMFVLSYGPDPACNCSVASPKEIRSTTTLDAANFGTDLTTLINDPPYFKTDDTFSRYVLGEDGLLNANNQLMRQRVSKIGSSVNSAPLLMSGELDMGYSKDTISTSTVTGRETYGSNKTKGFVNYKMASKPVLLAATNAGVVHVLNAAPLKSDGTTGVINPVSNKDSPQGAELGVFMPKTSMPLLKNYADEAYKFNYMTDGPLSEQDVYDSTAKKWRHLAIGTGGRATRSIFALNSPLKLNESEEKYERVPEKEDFLWERSKGFSGADYANMSFQTDKATAGQLQEGVFGEGDKDGTWVVLTTSGFYVPKGSAPGLFVLDAINGSVKKFIPLPDTEKCAEGQDKCGLSGAVALRDKTRRIVAAYAGSTSGKLWRFDLRKDKMKLSYNDTPVFETDGGLPITATPAWQGFQGGGSLPNGDKCMDRIANIELKCGVMLAVGTGMLLDGNDAKNIATQKIYGVWDPTAAGADDAASFTTIKEENLAGRKVVKDSAVTKSLGTFFRVEYTDEANKKIKYVKDEAGTQHRGWKLALGVAGGQGERMLEGAKNLIRGRVNSFVFTTLTVDRSGKTPESCPGTERLLPPSTVYAFNVRDPGSETAFDVDGDKKPDPFSVLTSKTLGAGKGASLTATPSSSNSGSAGETPKEKGLQNEQVLPVNPPQCDSSRFSAQIHGAGAESLEIHGTREDCGWRRAWRSIQVPPV